MARFIYVKVVLTLLANSTQDAETIAAALAVDDESDCCSKVSTKRVEEKVVVEIECWCRSPLACARSIADDVLRNLNVLAFIPAELDSHMGARAGSFRSEKFK
jgi:hypothetical protein